LWGQFIWGSVFFSQAVVTNSKDVHAHPVPSYQRHNIIYLSKSVQLARSGLEKFQSLNLVGDEARCSNKQIMTVFVSTPIAHDVAHGFVAPIQVNPDLHLDLDDRSIAVRIATALDKAASGLPCKAKPQSDELVSTWHVCKCLDNALLSSLGKGLFHFKPAAEQVPMHLRAPGKYLRSGDGRWKASIDTEHGPEETWLFPSPEHSTSIMSVSPPQTA
jgi:hypothetical protein